jgi:hypothetical protein
MVMTGGQTYKQFYAKNVKPKQKNVIIILLERKTECPLHRLLPEEPVRGECFNTLVNVL